MNDTVQYLLKVEQELRTMRTIGEASCSEFSNLPADKQVAFAKAIEFLGCRNVAGSSDLTVGIIDEPDRIQAVRLMCFKLFVDTGEPRWSSSMLERMLAAAMAVHGGSVTDIFRALLGLLGESEIHLTPSLASFLKQVVVLCFTNYRQSYDTADFSWLRRIANESLAPAQAYLVLRCSPQDILSAYRESILKALENSSYKSEAIRAFSA